MEGIMALAQGKADLAGCHLWDPETETYNLPYLKKLLPGRLYQVVTLAQRRIGLFIAPGNPLQIQGISDLTRPGIRFINRQNGSGTRVWFDQQILRHGILPEQIQGYDNEKATHTEVAQMVAEGKADAGIGMECAANTFGLNFIFMNCERYDLVAMTDQMNKTPVQKFFDWLKTEPARQVVNRFDGYDTLITGQEQN